MGNGSVKRTRKTGASGKAADSGVHPKKASNQLFWYGGAGSGRERPVRLLTRLTVTASVAAVMFGCTPGEVQIEKADLANGMSPTNKTISSVRVPYVSAEQALEAGKVAMKYESQARAALSSIIDGDAVPSLGMTSSELAAKIEGYREQELAEGDNAEPSGENRISGYSREEIASLVEAAGGALKRYSEAEAAEPAGGDPGDTSYLDLESAQQVTRNFIKQVARDAGVVKYLRGSGTRETSPTEPPQGEPLRPARFEISLDENRPSDENESSEEDLEGKPEEWETRYSENEEDFPAATDILSEIDDPGKYAVAPQDEEDEYVGQPPAYEFPEPEEAPGLGGEDSDYGAAESLEDTNIVEPDAQKSVDQPLAARKFQEPADSSTSSTEPQEELVDLRTVLSLDKDDPTETPAGSAEPEDTLDDGAEVAEASELIPSETGENEPAEDAANAAGTKILEIMENPSRGDIGKERTALEIGSPKASSSLAPTEKPPSQDLGGSGGGSQTLSEELLEDTTPENDTVQGTAIETRDPERMQKGTEQASNKDIAVGKTDKWEPSENLVAEPVEEPKADADAVPARYDLGGPGSSQEVPGGKDDLDEETPKAERQLSNELTVVGVKPREQRRAKVATIDINAEKKEEEAPKTAADDPPTRKALVKEDEPQTGGGGSGRNGVTDKPEKSDESQTDNIENPEYTKLSGKETKDSVAARNGIAPIEEEENSLKTVSPVDLESARYERPSPQGGRGSTSNPGVDVVDQYEPALGSDGKRPLASSEAREGSSLAPVSEPESADPSEENPAGKKPVVIEKAKDKESSPRTGDPQEEQDETGVKDSRFVGDGREERAEAGETLPQSLSGDPELSAESEPTQEPSSVDVESGDNASPSSQSPNSGSTGPEPQSSDISSPLPTTVTAPATEVPTELPGNQSDYDSGLEPQVEAEPQIEAEPQTDADSLSGAAKVQVPVTDSVPADHQAETTTGVEAVREPEDREQGQADLEDASFPERQRVEPSGMDPVGKPGIASPDGDQKSNPQYQAPEEYNQPEPQAGGAWVPGVAPRKESLGGPTIPSQSKVPGVVPLKTVEQNETSEEPNWIPGSQPQQEESRKGLTTAP